MKNAGVFGPAEIASPNLEINEAEIFFKTGRGVYDEEIQPESSDEPPNFVAKMFQDAEFEAAGINITGLDKETAASTKRARQIYKKIAANAEAKVSDNSLAKRASAQKVVRTEVTKYASGREVVAEIGEDGAVIRTYEKAAS
jgi:hypothetical protein